MPRTNMHMRTRPAEATITATILQGLCAAADARAIQVVPWLADTGLTRQDVEASDLRVPVALAASIIERALRDLPADIGLELGPAREVLQRRRTQDQPFGLNADFGHSRYSRSSS